MDVHDTMDRNFFSEQKDPVRLTGGFIRRNIFSHPTVGCHIRLEKMDFPDLLIGHYLANRTNVPAGQIRTAVRIR